MVLDALKKMLDIDETRDRQMIEKLMWIVETTEQRLKILLGSDSVPEELEYIVTEVSIVRFNRISSEGASSHTVEGESVSYLDDDFAGYRKDIEAWLANQEKGTQGKVVFI